MSLVSVLAILLVSVALIVAVLREFRFFARARHQKAAVLLHSFRVIGLFLVGFGILGQILVAAGYGGTGRTIEVDRWHPVLGNLGTGYREGPTRLGEFSVLGAMAGLMLLLASTLGLWGIERRTRSSSQRMPN